MSFADIAGFHDRRLASQVSGQTVFTIGPDASVFEAISLMAEKYRRAARVG
jgi:hypothetical protein